MKRYVSLLRGINVGGRIVKMADLVNVYETAGMLDVKTLLQSGNVIFSSNLNDIVALRAKLEPAVTKKFNYNAKIFVLSREKLKQIFDNYPFATIDDNYQNYIIFMEFGLASRLYEAAKLLKLTEDKITLGNEVIYWQVAKGMTVNSPFSKLLIKTEFREFHTNRNIKTVMKLLS
jgi:uncharacterized protein (DUF1697 family)